MWVLLCPILLVLFFSYIRFGKSFNTLKDCYSALIVLRTSDEFKNDTISVIIQKILFAVLRDGNIDDTEEIGKIKKCGSYLMVKVRDSSNETKTIFIKATHDTLGSIGASLSMTKDGVTTDITPPENAMFVLTPNVIGADSIELKTGLDEVNTFYDKEHVSWPPENIMLFD